MAVRDPDSTNKRSAALTHALSFASFLSSLSGNTQQSRAPTTSDALRPSPASQASQSQPNGARLTASNAVAGVKRKPEDSLTSPAAKVLKTGEKLVRPLPARLSPSPLTATPTSSTPYRGTTRPTGAPKLQTAVNRPISSASVQARPAAPGLNDRPKVAVLGAHGGSRPAAAGANGSPKPAVPGANGGPKPAVRGYAATLAKAKAAEEAGRAAALGGIQHKPVEKTSRRDRERQEAKELGAKGGKVAQNGRSKTGIPGDPKAKVRRKAPELEYKGTMKKSPVPLDYKGTMRPADSLSKPRPSPARKPVLGRPKPSRRSTSYVDDEEGLASEDDAEGYDSAASSDMEAGIDDVEIEETAALRAAKKEDQEALAEENAHKREKLERQRRLQALSKTAAAAKKRY